MASAGKGRAKHSDEARRPQQCGKQLLQWGGVEKWTVPLPRKYYLYDLSPSSALTPECAYPLANSDALSFPAAGDGPMAEFSPSRKAVAGCSRKLPCYHLSSHDQIVSLSTAQTSGKHKAMQRQQPSSCVCVICNAPSRP